MPRVKYGLKGYIGSRLKPFTVHSSKKRTFHESKMRGAKCNLKVYRIPSSWNHIVSIDGNHAIVQKIKKINNKLFSFSNFWFWLPHRCGICVVRSDMQIQSRSLVTDSNGHDIIGNQVCLLFLIIVAPKDIITLPAAVSVIRICVTEKKTILALVRANMPVPTDNNFPGFFGVWAFGRECIFFSQS